MIVILFQFDSVKRRIGSYNHKIGLPNYISDLQVNTIWICILSEEPITKGFIPKERILDFYKDINGEQVIIDSKPIGGIKSWATRKSIKFSIIYRNFEGNLNGINISDTGKYYFIEIESHYD